MSRYRRWNELLELLAADGQLQVEQAAKALGVSAATVRRDFDELASQQMLTRIRGGAVAQGINYDLPLRYKSERHPSEKHRIADAAAGLVRTGQIAGLLYARGFAHPWLDRATQVMWARIAALTE